MRITIIIPEEYTSDIIAHISRQGKGVFACEINKSGSVEIETNCNISEDTLSQLTLGKGKIKNVQ